MAKIVSRVDQKGQLITYLQEMVRSGTSSLLGDMIEESEVEVGTTLENLIAQVDELLTAHMLSIKTIEAELEQAQEELVAVKNALDISEELNSKLMGDIGYDDALDEATGDLMQSLMACGIAESVPNGEIVFDNRVIVGRAELKPILRDAIATWIEKRLSE
jgi:hypothetical protein